MVVELMNQNLFAPTITESELTQGLWQSMLFRLLEWRVNVPFAAGTVTGIVGVVCYQAGNTTPLWDLFSMGGLISLVFFSALSFLPSLAYFPPKQCSSIPLIRCVGGFTFGIGAAFAELAIRRFTRSHPAFGFLDYMNVGNLALAVLAGCIASVGIQMILSQRFHP